MFNSQQYPLNACLFKIKIKYLHISIIVFKSYLGGFTFKNIIFRFSEFIEDKHIYWNLKFPLSALKMKIEKSISNVGTIKFEDKCLIPQFKLSLFCAQLIERILIDRNPVGMFKSMDKRAD